MPPPRRISAIRISAICIHHVDLPWFVAGVADAVLSLTNGFVILTGCYTMVKCVRKRGMKAAQHSRTLVEAATSQVTARSNKNTKVAPAPLKRVVVQPTKSKQLSI